MGRNCQREPSEARRSRRPSELALAGLALAALCLGLGCQQLPPGLWPFGAGTVEGRVVGDAPEEGAWVVVYLEGSLGRSWRRAETASLRGGTGGFSPPVLAVAVGQSVEVANGDAIHHRFFSSSRPNDFELPTLVGGESLQVAFDHPGAVRIYCSLHPDESGTIFVAPSRYFATVRAPGRYAIQKVPPGRYALHTWSEGPAAATREIAVQSGTSAFVELALEGSRP
jgi:plastocyanin